MWMTDHLMNRELGNMYGMAYARIPLKASPNIRCADAFETDWNGLLPAVQCDYILGNPPFGGSKTPGHQGVVKRLAGGGTLDHAAAWFLRAAEYTEANRHARIGFVATNSLVQGGQVGQLWPILLDGHGLSIQYAYTPFKWSSEASGTAHVHVVIIGLGRARERRRLFRVDGDDILEENPRMITPYLHGAESARVVRKTALPLNGLPELTIGSQTIFAEPYIFSDDKKEEFLGAEPGAGPYLKPYVGADEFINGGQRGILALHDIKPEVLRRLRKTMARVEEVRKLRLGSKRKSTLRLAETPTAYGVSAMPASPFLAVPSTSSERRKYVPIGYLEPPTIPSHALMIIPDAPLGLFGLLTSYMHMVWLDRIGGRLETRYRYSAGMVYNTFPVPDSPLDALEPHAQRVLDARAAHPDSTLADLYDQVTMPPDLVKAHRRLDRNVDKMYRRKPFNSDDERIEFLLDRYEGMVSSTPADRKHM